ncbi:MAG TPA: transporter [Acetobacteraceae bacterium]|nr:transporter [Acetobacteraceae bacterium]
MQRSHGVGIAALVLWLAGGPAGRADPPGASTADYTLFNPTPDADLRGMDTDRPNHVDTPHTVDAGHIQIEAGLADFVRQWQGGAGSGTAFATGQLNARVGITDAVELNLELDSFDWQRLHDSGTHTATGIGDLTFGGKVNFWGNSGSDDSWATALAIKPQVKLPTAGSTLGDGHVEAYAEFPFLMNLPAGFHLGLQTVPGIVRNYTNTAYVGGVQNAISIDRVVVADADVYVEYWSQVTTRREAVGQQTLDVGFTYPLTKNLVLDNGAFFGLNHYSTSFEYVAGFSIRY